MKTKDQMLGENKKLKVQQRVISIILLVVMTLAIVQLPNASLFDARNRNDAEQNTTSIATTDEVREVLSEEMLNRAGIHLYASEEEYLAEQKVLGQQLLAELDTYQFSVFHSFKVLDKKTNKPITGALVVIDGTPYFSDANGQINVKIMSEVIELRVEKSGYNPYVEYYDVYSASEKGVKSKTVYLKNPSSDLEIYNATLDYFGENANVVEQNYTFDKAESEGDTFDIKVEADADEYYLYIKGEQYTSKTGVFTDIGVDLLSVQTPTIGPSSPNEVEIAISKNGIVSDKTPVKIGVVELSDLEVDDYLKLNVSNKLSFDLDNSDFLGKVEIDFLDLLREALGIKKGKVNTESASIQVVHNNLLGTYDFIFGVDLNIRYKRAGSTQEEVKEKYFKENRRVMNSFKRSYRMRRNNPNPKAKSQSVCQSLFGAFKKGSQTLGAPINLIGMQKTVDFTVQFIAHIELSEKVFTGEIEASQGVFSGGVDIELGVQATKTAHFIVSAGLITIPFYIQISMGGALDIKYEYNEASRFLHSLYLALKFNARIEVGVGIKDILSAGVYGKGELAPWWEIISGQTGGDVYLSFGVLISIIGFDIDYKIVDEKPILSKSTSLAMLASESQESANSTYLDARPQSAYLGEEKVSVWLEKADTRDMYNKTRLMYAYGDTKGAVWDDGKTDFYPELQIIDGEAYLAWHKSTAVFNGETTLQEAFAQSKIVVSKLNKKTRQFETLTEFNDGSMHTLPVFAQDSTREKLAIAWWSNNDGNPLGNSGTNQICYAECINGVWGASQVLFETDKAISSYDIAYLNGEIKLSCAVDEDGDRMTTDDMDLYYGSAGNMQDISNDDIMQAAPQFGKYLGQTVLYYYQENSLYLRNLDSGEEMCVLQDSGFNGRYQLLDGHTSQILYTRQGAEEAEVYLAKYDAASSKWVSGMNMMIQNKYADFSACQNGETIEVIGVTYEDNSTGDGIVIGSIHEESLTSKNDIALLEAYMLDTVKVGTNIIYCHIQNKGANSVNTIDFYVNGNKQTISLADTLMPGEESVVKLDYEVTEITPELTVKAVAANDAVEENNSFKINVDYADLDMEVMQRIVNGKELIDLKLTNNGYRNENVSIRIHRGSKDGEVIYTEENININAGASVEKGISIDYYAAGCQKNDKLYIEVVSDSAQAVDCAFSILITEDIKDYTQDEVADIQDLLTTAQKLLGVII